MPTSDDFNAELRRALSEAEASGFQAVELAAGALHRRVGADNRMPMSCDAMRRAMKSGDEELPNNLKRDGASYAVRYRLPR